MSYSDQQNNLYINTTHYHLFQRYAYIIKLKFIIYRPSSEIVQMLTPYFEVDYLLPRTLLASLSLQMFHEVLMNNMFPADITLAASLSHFCDFRDSQELVSFIMNAHSEKKF